MTQQETSSAIPATAKPKTPSPSCRALCSTKSLQTQSAISHSIKKLEEQRQEETERRNEEKAADDLRNKQEEAVRKEEKEENEHEEANGNDPYTPGEKVDDKLENNVKIIVTIVPHDDRPPLNVIPPLPVNKNTQLPACGYVSLPANREFCTGRTASGGPAARPGP